MISKTIKTNDIKKGMSIITKDGLRGTMDDNMKGITRMVKQQGPIGPTMGAMYVFNIAQVWVCGEWLDVELTTEQKKKMQQIKTTLGDR